MKRTIFFLSALTLTLALACCGENKPKPEPVDPEDPQEKVEYHFGADIGWITEMESKGFKFFNTADVETECTSLMKEIGCTAIRHRVWVNPSDGWCNAQDLLEKCKRAQKLGLKIMVDFHYSDWWADPGKQNIPQQWSSYDAPKMAEALAQHTKDVLTLLKDNKIDVEWVQVGNEVNTGMLWPVGKVTNDSNANFISLLNSGYDAVKAVYPAAKVILHHSNAQNLDENKWFFDIVKKAGGKYDVLGLSLYPSYWDSSINGYPDWKPACQNAVRNFSTLHDLYGKPVTLVEFGMPVSQPDKAAEALSYLIENTVSLDFFGGIYYWEPESEKSRNGYDYGAFADGRPTAALAPFKQSVNR